MELLSESKSESNFLRALEINTTIWFYVEGERIRPACMSWISTWINYQITIVVSIKINFLIWKLVNEHLYPFSGFSPSIRSFTWNIIKWSDFSMSKDGRDMRNHCLLGNITVADDYKACTCTWPHVYGYCLSNGPETHTKKKAMPPSTQKLWLLRNNGAVPQKCYHGGLCVNVHRAQAIKAITIDHQSNSDFSKEGKQSKWRKKFCPSYAIRNLNLKVNWFYNWVSLQKHYDTFGDCWIVKK